MSRYHLVTPSSERPVVATEVLVHNGVLVFRNEEGDDILLVAEGAWTSVELLTLDEEA